MCIPLALEVAQLGQHRVGDDVGASIDVLHLGIVHLALGGGSFAVLALLNGALVCGEDVRKAVENAPTIGQALILPLLTFNLSILPVDMQPIGEWDPIELWLVPKGLANAYKDATDAADAFRQRNSVPGGCSPLVNGQGLGQIGESVADALEFLFTLRHRALGHVVGNVVQVANGHVHAVNELHTALQLGVHLRVQQILVRRRNGQTVVDAHIGITLRLALARLPDLLIAASEEMIPDLALGDNRMAAHPVHKLLQLDTSMLHKLLLVAARDLLVRQRRHRNQTELVHQSLVQPVEVLVATRHLKTKAKTQIRYDQLIMKCDTECGTRQRRRRLLAESSSPTVVAETEAIIAHWWSQRIAPTKYTLKCRTPIMKYPRFEL